MSKESPTQVKRGPGRPRKNQDTNTNTTSNTISKITLKNQKINQISNRSSDKTKKTFSKRENEPESKLFLYLQGSSDSEDEDNNFTETDALPYSDRVKSLTDYGNEKDDDSEYSYEYETDSDDLLEESEDEHSLTITPIDYSQFNTKDHDVLLLLKHIRKRDALISRLARESDGSRRKTSKPGVVNPLHVIKGLSRNNNIEYHCHLADTETEEKFVPCPNDLDCWWCDHGFDNIPVYLPQMYRDQIFYVFGNFCSYNCALRYNYEMKDTKVRARTALLVILKDKSIGSDNKIKPADRRELLKSKGGPHTIQQFRQGFSYNEESAEMDMPPMIPLVHVIKYV